MISVGADNDYGHPAPETVAALESTGARVLRTDRDGSVAIVERPGSPVRGDHVACSRAQSPAEHLARRPTTALDRSVEEAEGALRGVLPGEVDPVLGSARRNPSSG